MQQKLSGHLWRGHLVGTNSGPIIARFDAVGDVVQVRALFWDTTRGPSLVEADGQLEGSNLQLVMTRLGSQRPPYSALQLVFDSDFDGCFGKWVTSYMTGGTATLKRATRRSWVVDLGFAWLVGPFVFFRWLNIHIRTIYALTVLLLALLDGVTSAYHLNSPALVIFLVAAAYLYQDLLLDVVRRFGIRRIGGVELQPSPQSPPGATAQDLAAALAGMPEPLLLLALDSYLVARTKALLAWLVHREEEATRDQLFQRALELGITNENIGPTLEALLITGCVAIPDGERIKATERGMAIVRQIARLAGGEWLPAAGA